jgi:hypothetical protein
VNQLARERGAIARMMPVHTLAVAQVPARRNQNPVGPARFAV